MKVTSHVSASFLGPVESGHCIRLLEQLTFESSFVAYAFFPRGKSKLESKDLSQALGRLCFSVNR